MKAMRRVGLAAIAISTLVMVGGSALSATPSVRIYFKDIGDSELSSPHVSYAQIAWNQDLAGEHCRRANVQALAPTYGTPLTTYNGAHKCGHLTAKTYPPTGVVYMQGQIVNITYGGYFKSQWFTRAGVEK